jgi:carbamate kinase
MADDDNERSPRVVVALGGNAITRQGEEGTVEQDYVNLRASLDQIVMLLDRGYEVILTHGNGPQIGNHMIRVELARGQAPDLPLDVMVADLQGGLGYMIELVLRNRLLKAGMEIPLCTLLTQVEVSLDDPALADPTKFVGPAFDKEKIDRLAAERGWVVREDKGRGWRRVVPSPRPVRILEAGLIRTLVEAGTLVIVTGGGGIPVARGADGDLHGVEAVIDKDYAAAELAKAVHATHLFVLTSVSSVFLDFGTPRQRPVRFLTVAEARRHLAAGQFPAGSMAPKIDAACRFVEGGGNRALITDIMTVQEAIDGSAGTWITA